MALILTVLAVFLLLCTSELCWRKRWCNNEVGRKFVHITVGSFVAFWPFFLTWDEIRLLSLAFILVVVVSKHLRIFRSIHSVQRPTYGEIFFAITVGLLTFVTQSKGIYAAAILQMSLADGVAAIVGTQYGKKNRYRFMGHTKSLIGTAAFFVTSVVLLMGYNFFSGAGLPAPTVALLAAATTGLENVAAFGLDNLLVPLCVAAALNYL